jgi:REP element-mobilizing transposase RayT
LIFLDDDDRRFYLALLAGVADRFGWHVLGYCLMPNHVHLVVETREPNLGRGMHALHTVYAQHFNERWDRVGHLFQSRFGSRELRDEHALAVVLGYVVVNPVAAGLCAAPEDWLWSSHTAAIAGTAHSLVDLRRMDARLAPLGPSRQIYRAFVEARLLSRGLPAPA